MGGLKAIRKEMMIGWGGTYLDKNQKVATEGAYLDKHKKVPKIAKSGNISDDYWSEGFILTRADERDCPRFHFVRLGFALNPNWQSCQSEPPIVNPVPIWQSDPQIRI